MSFCRPIRIQFIYINEGNLIEKNFEIEPPYRECGKKLKGNNLYIFVIC